MSHKSDEPFAPGTMIGPYSLKRVLGEGAFGVVYEASKQPLEKRIALKILRAGHAQDPYFAARFVKEARAAASIKHPHIVEVDDVGVVDGVPYLAMEFLDGQSLAERIDRGGRMDVFTALDLLLPVLSAVEVVHAKGIIHRDLKPDNIFLWSPISGQTQPKLLDFGIAKYRAESTDVSLTATGTVIGTPRYMPPEQWGSSKNASAQSDQWALGVILYECLAGVAPFDAEELHGLVLKVATQPPEPLRAMLPDLPEELERVVLKTLEKDPTKRYPSVRDLGRALLPFASPSARVRWSAEFNERGEVATAPTMFISQRPVSLASPAHPSPTLDRSATELAVRPPSKTSRAAVVGWSAGVTAVVALAVMFVVDPGGLRGRASSTAPTARVMAPAVRPAIAESVVVAPAVAAPAVAAPAVAAPAVAAPLAAPVVDPPPLAPVAAAAPREPAAHGHHRGHRRHGAEAAVSGEPPRGEMPNF